MNYTVEYFQGNWSVRHSEGWIAFNGGSLEEAVRWISERENKPVRVAILNPQSL